MKEQFYKSLNVTYDEIMSNSPIQSYKDFKIVKNYIFDNPNDNDVLIIKNWILNTYQNIFLDPNFLNSFNLSDDLRYMKLQLIYKYLPFIHNHQNYPSYFYSLLFTEAEYYGTIPNFYKGCFAFFKEQGNCLLTDEQIDKINKYMEDNDTILNGTIDTYSDFNTEYLRYKNTFLNKYDEDYKEFKQDIKISESIYGYYNGNIKKAYEYKKLGNVGELYVYEKIKNLMNPIFTSRDLKNGFGFDMYFQSIENNITYENLVEVKSTANLNGDDYFSISENEYNTMINSHIYGNVNYYVCRVFVDINNPNFECHFLKFENNTLKSINGDLEYVFDKQENDNYYFKRKQKVKVLQ